MASRADERIVYLADVDPPSNALVRWERQKRKAPLLIQCIAEAFGTFVYTYAGASATASYVLGNILGIVNMGSVLQIGVAYAIGIVLAVVLALPTSGGYLSPGFTVYAMVARKCGVTRGCALIVAQIVGAWIACLLIYVQWHNDFMAAITAIQAKGLYDETMFTSAGPGGVLAFYVLPGTDLRYVFLNEFVVDCVLAAVIIGSTDPTNHFCPHAVAPWFAGMAYGMVAWGFAGPGLAANSARDMGGRLAALCIWGTPASGGRYAAISALTSIPASIVGGYFYQFFLADHSRPLTAEHVQHMEMARAAADRKMGDDASDIPGSPESFIRADSLSKA